MERKEGHGRPGAPTSKEQGRVQKESREGKSSVSLKEKNVFDKINLHVDRMFEKGLITQEDAIWLKEYSKLERNKEDESKSIGTIFDCVDPTPIPSQTRVDIMLRREVITEQEALELEQLRSRRAENHFTEFTEEEDLWLRHMRASYFHIIPSR